VCSSDTDKTRADEVLIIKAKPEMEAARATVLRKADATMRRELGSLDLGNRGAHDSIKFRSLFFRNGSSEILDLGLVLSYEND